MYPDAVNITSPALFATWIKAGTDNIFFDATLFGIWVMMLLGFMAFGSPKEESFAGSSIIFMILCLMGKALNLITDFTLAASFIMVVAGIVVVWPKRGAYR